MASNNLDFILSDGFVVELPPEMKQRVNTGEFFCFACHEGMMKEETAASHVARHAARLRELSEDVKEERKQKLQDFMQSTFMSQHVFV